MMKNAYLIFFFFFTKILLFRKKMWHYRCWWSSAQYVTEPGGGSFVIHSWAARTSWGGTAIIFSTRSHCWYRSTDGGDGGGSSGTEGKGAALQRGSHGCWQVAVRDPAAPCLVTERHDHQWWRSAVPCVSCRWLMRVEQMLRSWGRGQISNSISLSSCVTSSQLVSSVLLTHT